MKRTYRRDPLSSLILTAGVVDMVMGGVSDRWTLLGVGLGAVGVAATMRLWKRRQRPLAPPTDAPPIHYLPSRSSRTALPMLQIQNKKR